MAIIRNTITGNKIDLSRSDKVEIDAKYLGSLGPYVNEDRRRMFAKHYANYQRGFETKDDVADAMGYATAKSVSVLACHYKKQMGSNEFQTLCDLQFASQFPVTIRPGRHVKSKLKIVV